MALTKISSSMFATGALANAIGQDLSSGANVVFGEVKFSNYYATEGDLPSAATYHGMFAHVHATGKAYFAHASNWRKLLDQDSSNTDDLTEGSTNLYYTNARAIAAFSNGTGVSVYSNGNIAIGQSVATTDNVTFANVVTTGLTSTTFNTTDITVTGNLTVQGTTTTIDSTNLSVNDSIITVASGQASAAPSLDAGLEVHRGTSANTYIKWNETNDKWTFTNDGSTYANIATSTTDLAEGTNQYYTTARANTDFDARLATSDTDGLSEGATNLYFTNARAVAALSNGTGVSVYSNGTIAIGQDVGTSATMTLSNLTITGNLTVQGTSNQATSTTASVSNADLILLSDHSGAPTSDATITINRGSSANTSLKWNETSDRWTFTNDGSTFYNLPTTAENYIIDVNQNQGTVFAARNANTSTSSLSGVQLGDSGSSNRGGIAVLGSGFTASQQYRATETYIYNNGTSGITMHAENAAGTIKIACGNNPTIAANSSSMDIYGTARFQKRIAVGDGNIPYVNTGTAGMWISNGGGSTHFVGSYDNNTSYLGMYTNGTWRAWLTDAGVFHTTGGLDSDGSVQASYYVADMAVSGSGDDQAAMRFSQDHQGWDTLYAGTPGSTNGWGTFWAGSTGAQYGTNGTGGVGNIWSNSGNPNEFVIVGNGQSVFAVQMNDGNSWTKNTADVGTDGSVNNTGVGIRYGNYNSGYGRIRFYQGGSNHSTIHSFSSSWQGGSLAGHSTGALNIEGGAGVTFGPWNALDGYIDTAGNMTMAGNITANSDRRIKTNIETIDGALDKVLKLRGVRFNKTEKGDPDKKYVGVIAQEVEEVLPEVVMKADDERGTLSVDYGNIVGVLIEAIKEQQVEINRLKEIIESK